MKKFLFGALITLFLAACAGLAPTAWSPEEAQAMATVHELMSPSPAGLCSAITISKWMDCFEVIMCYTHF